MVAGPLAQAVAGVLLRWQLAGLAPPARCHCRGLCGCGSSAGALLPRILLAPLIWQIPAPCCRLIIAWQGALTVWVAAARRCCCPVHACNQVLREQLPPGLGQVSGAYLGH